MAASLEWQSLAKGFWATLSNSNLFSFPNLRPTSWEFNFHPDSGSWHSKEFSMKWVIPRDHSGSLNPKRAVHVKGRDLKGVTWDKGYEMVYVDFLYRIKNGCTCSTWASLLRKPYWAPRHCSNLPSAKKLSGRSSPSLSLLLSHELTFHMPVMWHAFFLFNLGGQVPRAPTN